MTDNGTSKGLFCSSLMHVRPEWIDYNGHLNMAYYNVLFAQCVVQALTEFGLGPDYLKQNNASFFTMEAHVTYLREIHEGDGVNVTFRVLDFDEKRLHCFQQLIHTQGQFLSATSESMLMHVDMSAKKSAPFPTQVRERIAAMHAIQKDLPRPPQQGHVIGLPRRQS